MNLKVSAEFSSWWLTAPISEARWLAVIVLLFSFFPTGKQYDTAARTFGWTGDWKFS